MAQISFRMLSSASCEALVPRLRAFVRHARHDPTEVSHGAQCHEEVKMPDVERAFALVALNQRIPQVDIIRFADNPQQ